MRLIFSLPLLILFFLTFCISTFGQSSFDKGKALYEARKFSDAEKQFKTISINNPSYSSAQYFLGRIAFDKNEYEEASKYFMIATERDTKNSDYFYWLGNAYSEEAKIASIFTKPTWASNARKAYEKSAALDSRNIKPRLSLIIYYSVVPSIMGGSMEKAKTMAYEVTKLNEAEGHWQLGSLFSSENNISQAEEEFTKMLNANPYYVRNLAGYFADQKKFEKAFEFFEQAIKNDPNDFPTLYQYGKASALSGLRLDKGEEYLKQYLAYLPQYGEPSLAGAYMRLGQIMEKKGNKIEAKKNYETSLKMNSSLKEAKQGLARVR